MTSDSPEKDGKDGKETAAASSSWMMSSAGASSSSGPAPAASQAGAQEGRQDSQDDVSTIAPSEGGEDATRRDDNASESGSEVGDQERCGSALEQERLFFTTRSGGWSAS